MSAYYRCYDCEVQDMTAAKAGQHENEYNHYIPNLGRKAGLGLGKEYD